MVFGSDLRLVLGVLIMTGLEVANADANANADADADADASADQPHCHGAMAYRSTAVVWIPIRC